VTLSIVVLWLIALVLVVIALRSGEGQLKAGVLLGCKIVKGNILILILAFIIVGFVDVLAPQNLIEKYLGPESGILGLLLAEAIGVVLPGGPYAVFPIIGVLYDSGAGVGPMATLVTSYSLLALLTISFELPFMGWRFTVVRWGLGLIVPLLVGVVAMIFS